MIFLTSLAQEPPALGITVFYHCNKLKYVFIPDGKKNSYEKNWRNFKFIERPDTIIGGVCYKISDNEMLHMAAYNNLGDSHVRIEPYIAYKGKKYTVNEVEAYAFASCPNLISSSHLIAMSLKQQLCYWLPRKPYSYPQV